MSLTKLTKNLNNIQSLPDKPSETPEIIKQLFDQAGNDIKEYINQILTAEIDTLISNIQSGKIDVTKIINNLTTGGATNVASAEMVKQLNNNKLNANANAVSATQLQTARKISLSGGAVGTATNFDGSQDITIPVTSLDSSKLLGTASVDTTGNSGSATKLKNTRTIALSGGATGTATNFNGTSNISIPVTSLDASKLTGTASVDTTGNSATATKLKTSRTINGTSFNGTDNIITAKWGTARTLALSGAVSGSASVDGSGNVTIETAQNNIAIFTGSFRITEGSQAGNTFITYPSGFNFDNCVVLAFGVTRSGEETYYDYASLGTFTKSIWLGTYGAQATVYKTSGSFTGSEYITYKIVLMKIS